MKRKTKQVSIFMEDLHKFIVKSPQFRKKVKDKSEVQIQTELRPLIVRYLEEYFKAAGYSDAVAKANKSFYWEGQEGRYGKGGRRKTFGSRNYPDFIITDPYLIAIEYKQSANGSTVKQGIGQSLLHTLNEEFGFVYYLFHDASDDKRIKNSIAEEYETKLIKKMWLDFNVLIKIT